MRTRRPAALAVTAVALSTALAVGVASTAGAGAHAPDPASDLPSESSSQSPLAPPVTEPTVEPTTTPTPATDLPARPITKPRRTGLWTRLVRPKVKFKGSVVDLPNAKVTVEIKMLTKDGKKSGAKRKKKWRVAKTVRTRANGKYKFSVTFPSVRTRAKIRVVAPGDANYRTTTSEFVLVSWDR